MDALAYAQELLQLAQSDPLLRYEKSSPETEGMAPFQRRFHLAARTHQSRFMLAPTKSGKTHAGAAESWWWLLDRHPWHPGFGRDSLAAVLCPDHTTGWPEISVVLHRLEPPDVLDASCRYVDGVGYVASEGRKAVQTRDGARLECKSCTQSVQALEGPRYQWAWINEVPKIDHFNALLGRLSYDGGPVFGTTTPIGRPTDWLRNRIEGNPDLGLEAEDPSWWVEHVELTYENVPHRKPGTIELQIARTDEWEHNQRILAQWDGVSVGRLLRAFSDAHLFVDADLPSGFASRRIGLDYGEGDGKTVAYLIGVEGRRIWLAREYVSTGETGFSPRDHARGVLEMLSSSGMTIYDIDEIHGDTNTAGLLAAGHRYNALLEQAIAAELGLTHCPVEIQPAIKRAGAPRASISAMNAAMREGRWFVHEDCTRFRHSARHFTGREKDLKDAIDAARYGVMDLLLTPDLPGNVICLKL